MSALSPEHLNNRHRDTLLQIFRHPTGHNIEWQHVLSLLEAVGTADRQRDGKYLVTIGTETKVVIPPKHKDIDVQLVIDLRRMLTSAGYRAVADELEAKGKET